MKKYVAFTTNSNSGITTLEKASDWAANQLGTKLALSHVHVAEVIQIVERASPLISTKSFFTELNKSVGEAEAA